MEPVIGIDLGTSNSAVAIVENGQTKVLPNERGEMTHASVVSFLEDGRVLVGNEAKRQILLNPNTVYSAKRLIGRKFFSSEVKKAKVICPYEIVEGPNSEVLIRINNIDYTLPEISAFVLKEMKRIAEFNLKQTVTKAVVTVPAYFNDGQRQATKDAGVIAGLDVLRIINEPTAAALSYGYGKGLQKNVVIYDLGGGTFDVSILNLGEDVYEVTATAGDTYLGGDDFDDRLVDYAAEEFVKKEGADPRSDNRVLQKLREAAEAVKKELSDTKEVQMAVQDLLPGKNLDLKITEALFRERTFDLIQKTFKVCDEALQSANMTIDDIDDVVLVGGPTKMRMIREAVGKYFFKEPLLDVDPDTVVAQGAAIQANLLTTRDDSALLLDVTPMSLGVGIAGGFVERLIERNTPIPTSYTHTFTTTKDGQTSVKIKIYQGESRKSAENEILGEFQLEGLRGSKRGEARIDVTFSIDTNGIVHVSARDQESGEEKSISINVAGGISRERLDELKKKSQQVELATSDAQ